MESQRTKPEFVVIVGQTASGKSDLAMRVAKEFGGEIIAADSWTVYKGFDVGTAKPSAVEQKQIRHHLIDVAEAEQGFNAPQFKELAQAVIDGIIIRGKLPVMVGGTGLYVDSVLYDFGFLDSVSGDDRAELDGMALTELIELASQRHIDMADIDIRNKRRVIRAIEAGGQKPTKAGLRPKTLVVGLDLPADQLKPRIEQRVDAMLTQGLEVEVKALAKKYGWDNEPMKGIGYREWREYFDGTQSLEQTRQRIISATNKLAKRQRTWFKRNADIHWFGSKDSAFDYIFKELNN